MTVIPFPLFLASLLDRSGGAPLGYVDWNIIGQGIVNGAASAAIFGATALAVDKAMSKGFLSRFPG